MIITEYTVKLTSGSLEHPAHGNISVIETEEVRDEPLQELED